MDEQVNFIQSTNQDQALNEPTIDASFQNVDTQIKQITQIEKPNPPVLSSCDCYSCKTNLFKLTKQTPKNCNFAKELECKNRINFNRRTEPMNKSGYYYLNPEIYTDYYAPDFFPMKCNEPNYPETVYVSNDPRLVSSAHNGQLLGLDRPALDEGVRLKDIYTDSRMKNFGIRYKNYEDIKVGQIAYYVDKSIEDALFQPNFEKPASVTGRIYKDPMGGTYPEYVRIPLKYENNIKTKDKTYTDGLSFLEQTNENKEDIMNLQMRNMNKTRYEPRWTGERTY
jgi:hypothetical protein